MTAPVLVANWPVRLSEVTIWNVAPMAGSKAGARTIASVPSSAAAPVTASLSNWLATAPSISTSSVPDGFCV